MEMGVINLEFYHNLQHITLRLTVEDPDMRDQLLTLAGDRWWGQQYGTSAI